MSDIVIDDAVAATLSTVKGEVVLRDSSGKEIGRFRRTLSQEEMAARNPFTWEELQEAERRAALEAPGLPLAEVWKRIRGESAS